MGYAAIREVNLWRGFNYPARQGGGRLAVNGSTPELLKSKEGRSDGNEQEAPLFAADL